MKEDEKQPRFSIFSTDIKDRQTIIKLLSKNGFKSGEFTEKKDLYHHAKDTDVLFLDMSCITSTDNILSIVEKLQAVNPNITIILLTGNSGREEVISYLKNGVFDVILKPLTTNRIVKSIEESIETRRSFLHIMGLSRNLAKANQRLEKQKEQLQEDKEELEKKMLEHSIIHEVSKITNKSLDIEDGLQECLSVFLSRLEIKGGSVILFDTNSKTYNYLKGDLIGLFTDKFLKKNIMIPSKISDIFKTDCIEIQPIIKEWLNKNLVDFKTKKEIEGISYIQLSLKTDEKLIGKLILIPEKYNDFITKHNNTFLSILASQVATLIDRVTLYKDMKKERDKLRSWNEDLNLFNEISHQIVSSLDADLIISIFAERLEKLVSYDIISLMFFENENVWTHSNKPEFVQFLNVVNEDTIKKFSNKVKRGLRLTGTSINNLSIPEANLDVNELRIPLEMAGVRVGLIRLLRLEGEYFNSYQSRMVSMLSSPLALALKNANVHNKVQEQARKDSLTNLLNKRSFETALENEFNNMVKTGEEFSLIMLDIDHFKNINDKYGHQVGDEALKEVARRILEGIRIGDTATRYGGEEFAIILPAISKIDAVKIAERIRKSMELNYLKIQRKNIILTISAGVASCPNPSILNAKELIERADKALYKAKNNGRNLVEHDALAILPAQISIAG